MFGIFVTSMFCSKLRESISVFSLGFYPPKNLSESVIFPSLSIYILLKIFRKIKIIRLMAMLYNSVGWRVVFGKIAIKDAVLSVAWPWKFP